MNFIIDLPSPRLLGLILAGAMLTSCAGSPSGESQAPSFNWYKDATRVGEAAHLKDTLSSGPFDVEMERAAEPGSRKCGGVGEDWGSALICIYRARAEHASALLAIRNFGIDSLLGWGIVSRADGDLVLYRYDSSPCGGGPCVYMLASATCKQIAEAPADGTKPKHICLDPDF